VPSTRPPAVAGSFYPADPGRLRDLVERLLSQAAATSGPPPAALIAPHAGYAYSGPVAGSAYALIAQHPGQYRRVVLIGPSHYHSFDGLALPGADAYATPLGEVAVDLDLLGCLWDFAESFGPRDAHVPDHAVEVHLPFLQVVLDEFTIVPLLTGRIAPRAVAEALARLWAEDQEHTLIVASSDLSHFHGYDTARRLDRATAAAIERLDPGGIDERGACGSRAVAGLLIEAANRGLCARTVDLRSSGDTTGGRREVVGYGAFVFSQGA
jgi:AmmeMemoRadiSam system protein B